MQVTSEILGVVGQLGLFGLACGWLTKGCWNNCSLFKVDQLERKDVNIAHPFSLETCLEGGVIR